MLNLKVSTGLSLSPCNARPTVTFLAVELHRPLAGSRLYYEWRHFCVILLICDLGISLGMGTRVWNLIGNWFQRYPKVRALVVIADTLFTCSVVFY